jgi:hypothetical protein
MMVFPNEVPGKVGDVVRKILVRKILVSKFDRRDDP